jgi:hypothetical protein
MAVNPVNEHDNTLFRESFDNLIEIADLLEFNLKGVPITFDSAFDSLDTKNEILVKKMAPVIKPNLRNLKDEEKRNQILTEFEEVEDIYKERFTIERSFAWEDTYRKLVVRYEKLQIIHMGFKYLAFSMINFRHFFGKDGH